MKRKRIQYNELNDEIYAPKYWTKTRLVLIGVVLLIAGFLINFSLEEKLNKIMYNDNSLEVKNNGNKLLLELSEKRKLRSDSKESIQHYSLNVEYDIFKLDLWNDPENIDKN